MCFINALCTTCKYMSPRTAATAAVVWSGKYNVDSTFHIFAGVVCQPVICAHVCSV